MASTTFFANSDGSRPAFMKLRKASPSLRTSGASLARSVGGPNLAGRLRSASWIRVRIQPGHSARRRELRTHPAKVLVDALGEADDCMLGRAVGIARPVA